MPLAKKNMGAMGFGTLTALKKTIPLQPLPTLLLVSLTIHDKAANRKSVTSGSIHKSNCSTICPNTSTTAVVLDVYRGLLVSAGNTLCPLCISPNHHADLVESD